MCKQDSILLDSLNCLGPFLLHCCVNTFTKEDFCTEHLFQDPVNGPLGFSTSENSPPSSAAGAHPQGILESSANSSDSHNLGEMLLGPGTV